jgi:hypothetical protein
MYSAYNGRTYATWPEAKKAEGHVAERRAEAPWSPRRPKGAEIFKYSIKSIFGVRNSLFLLFGY